MNDLEEGDGEAEGLREADAPGAEGVVRVHERVDTEIHRRKEIAVFKLVRPRRKREKSRGGREGGEGKKRVSRPIFQKIMKAKVI